MPRKKGMAIVVVVEDRQLGQFTRRTLQALGYELSKVRFRSDYPRGGKGSGKRYVEEQYPREVSTLRRKPGENRAVVIGTDADQQTVKERSRALDNKLSDAIKSSRTSDERVVYWIPKWHVETWGLHLTGTEVQEDRPYKNESLEINWREAGRNFKQEYDRSKTEDIKTLDSLKIAYIETLRLRV